MRPRGEIRQALAMAASELCPQHGPVSWIRMAEHAKVGYAVAQVTVKNMARSGELARAGKEKLADSPVWVTLYEPAMPVAPDARAQADLQDVVRCWAEFV